MSIKPILFSTPMVQAIMAGRKSMTRRVAKPQPVVRAGITRFIKWLGEMARFGDDISSAACDRKPKYQVGDILWVRETWQNVCEDCGDCTRKGFIYKADGDKGGACCPYEIKWRPSIFMPYEAARIFQRVTDVRVERVQGITEDDMIAEGVLDGDKYLVKSPVDIYPEWDKRYLGWIGWNRVCFEMLWNSINAKRGYGWAVNPWVWVYSFEPCDKPRKDGDTP